eukprot:s691_g19.t1
MGTGWMKLQEEHRWFGPDSSLGREAVGRSGKAQGHVASQVYSGWRRIAQQIRGDVASPLILKEVNFLQMLCFLLALCDRGLPCSNMPGKLLQGRPLYDLGGRVRMRCERGGVGPLNLLSLLRKKLKRLPEGLGLSAQLKTEDAGSTKLAGF